MYTVIIFDICMIFLAQLHNFLYSMLQLYPFGVTSGDSVVPSYFLADEGGSSSSISLIRSLYFYNEVIGKVFVSQSIIYIKHYIFNFYINKSLKYRINSYMYVFYVHMYAYTYTDQ